jgi:uncharacterized membrane protein
MAKMSETNKITRGRLVVVAWASSILLLIFNVALGLSELISEPTTTVLMIISFILFVGGFVILLWKSEQKPSAETTDDSQQEEEVLTKAEIRKQKRRAYILGIVLIFIGILPSLFGSSIGVYAIVIALGVIILIWAWFRPVKKN